MATRRPDVQLLIAFSGCWKALEDGAAGGEDFPEESVVEARGYSRVIPPLSLESMSHPLPFTEPDCIIRCLGQLGRLHRTFLPFSILLL